MEPSPPEVSPADGWTPWSQGTAEPEPDEGDGAAAGSDGEPDTRAGGAPAPARRRLSNQDQAQPQVSLGGIIAAIGGAVVIVGALLETLAVGIGAAGFTNVTLSQTYFDTDDGKIVAVLGAVIVIVALTTMVQRTSRLVAPIAVAACGIAAFGLALYDRIDIDSAADDARDRLSDTPFLQGVIQVNIGPALYVVMGGGVLVVIGAVLAARDR